VRRDVLAGEAGKQIGRQERSVAEWLIQSRDDLREKRDRLIEVQRLVVMTRAELLRHELRPSRLVEGRFIEADGERY
jgi:hypothetical protein